MAELIIDIRERIEKMRIKFEEDLEYDHSNIKNEISPNKKNNVQKEVEDIHEQKQKTIKTHKNNDLSSKEIVGQDKNNFPSVQLSVKNPISSKVLVVLMLLQVFSNIGIFMLLWNVLE